MLYDIIKQRTKNGKLTVAKDSIYFYDFLIKVEKIKDWLLTIKQKKIGLFSEDELSRIAALVALSATDKTCILIPEKSELCSPIPDLEVKIIAKPGFKFEIQYIYDCDAENETSGIAFFTSGSTGLSKLHKWKWNELFRTLTFPDFKPETNWLCGYSLDSFAGIQVLGYALSSVENIAFVLPGDVISLLANRHQTFDLMLSTPTFLRKILFSSTKNLSVKSISVSGEPVTQAFIDLVKKKLNLEKVIHIYASTELGSVYSVTDGKAGFPKEWLGKELGNGYTLFERDGMLFVRKPMSQEILPTGDCVVSDKKRVYITGRISDIINVGGIKVVRTKIEEVIHKVEGVQDVYVFGIANAITGHLVSAEIVPVKGVDKSALEINIKKTINHHFRKEWIPRAIKFVDSITMTRTGKKKRSEK